MLNVWHATRAPRLLPMFAATRFAVASLAIGACALLASPALAQVKDTAPYAAVVTAEGAAIRCGEGLFYKVADLAKGQVVQVDAESAGWLRVALPAGAAAYVTGADAKADEAAGTVRLSTPSALKAFNTTAGYAASWKALMPAPLPEGTTLKLLETFKDGANVVGYKVAAPAGAKGFVESKFLRKATPEEAAGTKAPESKPEAKPEAKPAAAPPPAPKPAEAKPAEAKPVEARPADGKSGVLEPMVPPGSPPVQAPKAEPKPAVIDQGSGEKPIESAPADPTKRRVGTPEDLEETFQAVRRQPEASAELDALYGELQRAVEQTGSDPKLKYRRVQLEHRRDYVKLRMDARDRLRQIEEAKRAIDEGNDKLRITIAELERQRVYTIIGLLVPSTVYDGKRLPLMYRLQAVGTTAPPTVGYIAPKAELQLGSKLGMVVGVVGEQTMDRSLNLNVINPMRVDVLQGAPGAGEVTIEKAPTKQQ